MIHNPIIDNLSIRYVWHLLGLSSILNLLFAPMAYARIDDNGYQIKLGHPSWTTCLNDYPDYKQYKPPKDIKVGCNWGEWITFSQKVEAIQIIVGKYTNPIKFFKSKDFLAMYMHFGYYYDAALAYLATPDHTLEQKKIVAYAMSKSGSLCKDAYKLYTSSKIDLQLLTIICSINISNIIKINKGYSCVSKVLQNNTSCYNCLMQMAQELPQESNLYGYIQEIFNNHFPESWRQLLYADSMLYQSYGSKEETLPFHEIITHAVEDYRHWQQHVLHYDPMPLHTSVPAYFLMILEHASLYYPSQFGICPGSNNGIDLLYNPTYSHEEKSIAILSMSQLESHHYAFMIENSLEWYKTGSITVQHLSQLFTCNFPTFYKYPFFILDYKDKSIQASLDKFIAEPTIPEGLKDLARKAKNGTLATKSEMAYMEGYRQFRKTHFTLYETVPPRAS